MASFEIEGLVSVLQILQREEPDFDNHQVLATLLRRVKDLNSVIMSVCGTDDRRDVAEMHEVVFGVAPQGGKEASHV